MKIDKQALDTIFLEARTHSAWINKEVPDSLLQEIYNIAKMGPTSANCSPLRVSFIKSSEAKARLKPFLDKGNIDKTMAAPITAIFAYDLEFYDKLPFLYPHADAKSWFIGKDTYIQNTAFRNSSLQGAYFIIAARSLGLDCGPMSGFNNAGLDNEFFFDSKIKSNFICNIGYGDSKALHPRSPRLSFEEACKVL
jgi:3-hydroxypropanoate dehydrogenase